MFSAKDFPNLDLIQKLSLIFSNNSIYIQLEIVVLLEKVYICQIVKYRYSKCLNHSLYVYKKFVSDFENNQTIRDVN